MCRVLVRVVQRKWRLMVLVLLVVVGVGRIPRRRLLLLLLLLERMVRVELCLGMHLVPAGRLEWLMVWGRWVALVVAWGMVPQPGLHLVAERTAHPTR
jgi:hypothetical protein